MEKQGDYFVNDLIQSTQLDIFLVKMRWIGRKKYIQEWMCASILISRASFHFPVPPAPVRRHKSILYLFRVVHLPNPSGESTWGNSEWGWVPMTAVTWRWLWRLLCLNWVGVTQSLDLKVHERHIHLNFTTLTDLLELCFGQVSGC